MEGARSSVGKNKNIKKKSKKVSLTSFEGSTNPSDLKDEIIRMEDLMYKHAKDLEFEEAASYRDRVDELKEILFMS